MTLAPSWGMPVEGEATGKACEIASSDCFIVGLGRVEKSQGRGTCKFQIVSEAIYRQPELATFTKATGIILKNGLCQGISQRQERFDIPSCCTYYTFPLVLPPDRIKFEINILRDIANKGKDFPDAVID
jgi:hypothetical protein